MNGFEQQGFYSFGNIIGLDFVGGVGVEGGVFIGEKVKTHDEK